jgi:hypothetical protein
MRRFGIVFRQHEGAGADRPPVQRQVLGRHAGLGEKTIDLARHRGKERHGQPVEELRVLAFEPDAPGMTIDFLDTGQREGIEIQPLIGRLCFGRLAKRCPGL